MDLHMLANNTKLIVGGDEFRIDLLLSYKTKMLCGSRAKNHRVQTKFAGKLSFYTSAVDEEIKDKNDNQP